MPTNPAKLKPLYTMGNQAFCSGTHLAQCLRFPEGPSFPFLGCESTDLLLLTLHLPFQSSFGTDLMEMSNLLPSPPCSNLVAFSPYLLMYAVRRGWREFSSSKLSCATFSSSHLSPSQHPYCEVYCEGTENSPKSPLHHPALVLPHASHGFPGVRT